MNAKRTMLSTLVLALAACNASGSGEEYVSAADNLVVFDGTMTFTKIGEQICVGDDLNVANVSSVSVALGEVTNFTYPFWVEFRLGANYGKFSTNDNLTLGHANAIRVVYFSNAPCTSRPATIVGTSR